MTQEEKSLLLKDLCARLPYGVKVRDELRRINKLVIGNADLTRLYYDDFSIYSEEKLSLPFLRPMSSITEEEVIEYASKWGKKAPYGVYTEYDWLNSHHFDYRYLIERDLALEAPEGMYNFQ